MVMAANRVLFAEECWKNLLSADAAAYGAGIVRRKSKILAEGLLTFYVVLVRMMILPKLEGAARGWGQRLIQIFMGNI